ncbi:hypothetical protein VRB36_10940 [Pseudomonas poae]|uniref:hypothetical protein n=1 Tax=Pseudomonas poae TaxID=200451 RepID=UPI0030D2FA03
MRKLFVVSSIFFVGVLSAGSASASWLPSKKSVVTRISTVALRQAWTAPAPVQMEGLVRMVARVPQAALGKMEDAEVTEVPE